ncbi:MAG: hypothetical protein AAGB93_00105 [Planctomycetota bacterium]
MTGRRLLHYARLVCLVAAILFGATAYAWRNHADLIQRVDDWIVRQYEHDPARDARRAADLIEAGRKDDALRILESRVPKLRGVLRGDRLESVRIRSLELISDLLAERGELERALEFADELHGLDDRDLFNALRRARLMERLERGDDAREIRTWAAAVGARNPEIRAAVTEAMLRDGDADGLLRMLLGLGRRGQLGGSWELRLDGKRLASGEPDIDIDGALRWSVELDRDPLPIRHVRVDLPREYHAKVSDVQVRLVAGDATVAALGLDVAERVMGLDAIHGTLVASGARDPFFLLVLPEELRSAEVTGIELTASVRENLGEEVRALVEGAPALADRAALVDEFGSAAVRRMEAALR